MGREDIINLSGFMNDVLSKLDELDKKATKKSKAIGQNIRDGIQEGMEDAVEEVEKSKEDMLRELDDAKRRFEQNLKKFPDAVKNFSKTLNSREINKVLRGLSKANADINSLRRDLDDIYEPVDISEWASSIRRQAEMLFESLGEQKEAIEDIGNTIEKQKQKLEKPVEIQVEFKDVNEAKQRIQELRKEMIAAARQLKELQGKPLNGENSQLYVTNNDLLTRNQREIDGIVAQLKKQGVAVRNTTKEYRELQEVLEDIGFIEKKENKRKPVNEDKKPTKKAKKQEPAAKEQTDKVVKAVEKKESNAPQIQAEVKALEEKKEKIEELVGATQKATKTMADFLELWSNTSKNYTAQDFGKRYSHLMEAISGEHPTMSIDDAYAELQQKEEEHQRLLEENARKREAIVKEMQEFLQFAHPIQDEINASDSGMKEFATITQEISNGALKAADAIERMRTIMSTSDSADKLASSYENLAEATAESTEQTEKNIKAKSKLQMLSDGDKKVLAKLFKDKDFANRTDREFDPVEELSLRVSATAFKRLRPRVKDIMNNAVSQLGLEYFGEAVEHYLNEEVLASSETLLFTLFEDYFKQGVQQINLDKWIEEIGAYPEHRKDAVKMLNGMSVNYSDFIDFSDTFGLGSINLRVPDNTQQIESVVEAQEGYVQATEEAINETEILETRVKKLVETANQIPQEPNTTRFVHFTRSGLNQSILENGLKLDNSGLMETTLYMEQYTEAAQDFSKAAEVVKGVAGHHGLDDNAIILDIPNDSIVAYQEGVGRLESVTSNFIKATVDTKNGIYSLNAAYDAGHDVVEDYADAVRAAKEAEESTPSRRPGVKRSDSLEAVQQRILDSRKPELPALSEQEHNAVFGSKKIDEWLENSYNISEENRSKIVAEFEKIAQHTKQLFETNSDPDALFQQLYHIADMIIENSRGDMEQDEQLARFYDYLTRGNKGGRKKIRYTDALASEFGDEWPAIRQRLGVKYLDKRGLAGSINVNGDWNELVDIAPGLFNRDEYQEHAQFKQVINALLAAIEVRDGGNNKNFDVRMPNRITRADRQNVYDDAIDLWMDNVALDLYDAMQTSSNAAAASQEKLGRAIEEVGTSSGQAAQKIEKHSQALETQGEQTNAEDDEPSDSNKPIDAHWLLKRDETDSLKRARLADANVTPVVDLSGIYSTEQLKDELTKAAKKIVDANDLTFGKLHIDGSIASIKLFNKELGKTVVDWYEVKEATEDATKSELQYLRSTLDHDAEAARKYTAAQDKKVEDGHNWLIQQLGKLDSREVAYKYSSKKISGNTEIWNEDHDEKYWGKTIDELAGEIRGKLQGAIGGALTEPFKNEIRDAMRVLDMEIKVEQSKQYVSGKLSAQQAQDAKATRAYELEKFTKKAQRNNVLPQLQGDIDAMQAELDSVTDTYTDGLNRFVDKMRIANAHFEAEMETVQGDQKEQRNYKKAEQAQTRLYNGKKRLAKLEAEGKTDAELSRRITERQNEYDAATKLLETEKSMNDILARQTVLETELANGRKQAEDDHAAQQRAAKEKQQADAEKQRISQLRSFYSERMKIQKEINSLDKQLNDFTLKDKGTGTYSSQIADIQTLKSGKIADLRTLEQQVNAAMSIGSADYTGGFNGFLEYCRENAILTAEEIQNLNKVLMQSEHIEQNFEIDSAKQKQDDQKKKYEDLLKLQKKYNDTDYKWHQADITGADKAPYNLLLTSYKNSMQELRKEIELTIEQQAELDRINGEHQSKKENLLRNTTEIDLKKEINAADEVRKAQNKLYEAKMQLAKLEAKGDTDSANWQRASRLVEEYEEQYQAKLNVLKTSERVNAALEREIRLAAEVDKLTQDSADKKAKEQSDDELKQYYTAQNERLKAYAQYGYQYNSQYGYNDVRGKTAADQTQLDSMSEYYKQEEANAKQFANNIKSTYDTILSITKQINDLDVKMNDLATKDKGSGLYSGWIDNLQTQKSSLVADMRQLTSEIAESLSIDPSQALHVFFERAQQDAILTTEEVQKFAETLMQAENIKFNFGAKVAEQTAPVIEKIAHLKQMIANGLITDKSTKLNIASINTNLNDKYNAFKASGSQADAIDFLKYANEVSEYVSQLNTAVQTEAKYFKNKKQYEYSAEGTDNTPQVFDETRQALEKYVQEFKDGKAVITGFSTSVDGISKIDFSWLDESTGQFHTFYTEMGKFTDDIHTYEATMKNMSAGTDAANETLLLFAQTLEKLNGISGVENIRDSLLSQMKTLERAKSGIGTSKDLGAQLGLKNQAADAEKYVKSVLKMIEELNSGKLINLGGINKAGNVFVQMYDKIKTSAEDATVSNVKFDNATNTLTYTLTDASGAVKQMTAHMDELGNVTARVEKIGQAKTWWQDLGSGVGGVGKEILRYGANMLQVMDVIRYLRSGFNEVKEIDTALTELKKVTNETDATYNNFLQTMSKTGAVVGSTVKDLTTSAADWARLGYSIEEAGKLAENTMILMNVSEFDNVSEATDSMISAIQAFKGENTDIGAFSMEIIDVFNQIGNSYAISTSDLADSLTRSSASLVAANNNLEQAVALTTAANTTIQNPEVVGTTLKTLAMRIRGVKTELEEAGEDTEGMITNTSKLQAKVQALTNVDGKGGVNILANSGEFKSTYDILLEISKVWDKMNDMDQAALLEIIAGKRAGSAVAGILQNGDILKSAYEDALGADGSAQQELSTYLDSIQGKLDQLSNSTQTMWMNFMNADVVKFFIELATGAVNLTDKIGLLNVAVAAFMAKTAFGSNNFMQFFDAGKIAQGVTDSLTNAGASATLVGTASTAASVGVKLLNSALTALTSIGVGIAITGIIKVLDELIPTAEEAAEAAENAIDAYESSQSKLSSIKSILSDLSDDYARLALGVDEFGNNINLTTSEYERYNEIVNQIADMFPHMVRGYTDEGNAIIKNKGSVEALTEAYKALQVEANNALISSADDIMKNYRNTVQGSFFQWDNSTSESIEAAKELDKILREQDTYDFNNFNDAYRKDYHDQILSMLDDAGISRESKEKNSEYVKRAVQEFPGIVQSIINTWNSTVNSAVSNVKPLVSAYLDASVGYASLTDEQKSIFDSIASSFDADFFNVFEGDASKMQQTIEAMILELKQSGIDDEYTTVLSLRTQLNNDEISVGEYRSSVGEFVAELDRLQEEKILGEENVAYIKLSLGIEEGEDNNIDTLIAHAQKVVDDGIKDNILTLNYSDLQIINSDNFNVDGSTISTWEQLQAEIKEAKILMIEDFTTDNFTDYADSISTVATNISTLQEALEKLESGQFTITDYVELIKQFPDLAKGVDVSSKKFKGLASNLKRAIRNSPEDLVEELELLRDQLIEAGKSTDDIDALIAAIENMPEDAVQSMSDRYHTLTDEINSAKIATNELKAAMEENPNEGYETRGEAIETMKTLMEEGRTGSESELWSIAEEFGFTYDSAKTIQENADALHKFITEREKWYKADKDGNYQFDGIESFIKDVEKKTQSQEFKDKLAELGLDPSEFEFTWDYENGVFDFDIDNKQWDAFAAAIGLTSEEFSDLMVQVGQFFGINWGDTDDALAYMARMTEGIEDPKKKLEEYGKLMEQYFGGGSTIDLTNRPEVPFDSTNFAAWEQYYQGVINNADQYTKEFVENAKEELASIQRGDAYATLYSSSFSNEDGTKTVVVTPILPDGKVLSPEELETYARQLLEGKELDPGINIKLAEFNGEDSIEQARKYGENLHLAQEEYYALSELVADPLEIGTILAESGLEGLSKIKELQDVIKQNSDGTTVVDEEAFTTILQNAGYAAEDIDALIKKIQEYQQIEKQQNIDPLGIKETGATIQSVSAALDELDIAYSNLREEVGGEVLGFEVDAKDLIATLKEKGWDKDKISNYIETLRSDEDGIDIGFDITYQDIETALAEAFPETSAIPVTVDKDNIVQSIMDAIATCNENSGVTVTLHVSDEQDAINQIETLKSDLASIQADPDISSDVKITAEQATLTAIAAIQSIIDNDGESANITFSDNGTIATIQTNANEITVDEQIITFSDGGSIVTIQESVNGITTGSPVITFTDDGSISAIQSAIDALDGTYTVELSNDSDTTVDVSMTEAATLLSNNGYTNENITNLMSQVSAGAVLKITVDASEVDEIFGSDTSETMFGEQYNDSITWLEGFGETVNKLNADIEYNDGFAADAFIGNLSAAVSDLASNDGAGFTNMAQMIVDGLNLLSSGELSAEDAATITPVITSMVTTLENLTADGTLTTGVGADLAAGIATGLTTAGLTTTATTVGTDMQTALQTALSAGSYSYTVTPAIDQSAVDAINSITYDNKTVDIAPDSTTLWTEFRRIANKVMPTKIVKIKYETTGEPAGVNGTAHARGTAYKSGSWGAQKTETALVGELGPEMVVRNGRWFTVGEGGAEFTDIQRGDIIFNHKQTEDLLSKGYVTGRGKAYAEGTAFASGGGTFKKYKFSDTSNSSSKKSSAAKTASKSDKEVSKDFKEIFDWIEVRLEEITEAIDLTTAKLDNAIGYAKQNNIIDELIDLNQSLYDNLIAGGEEYYDFSEELLKKIPEEYREMAQDGSIAITDFTGKVGDETLDAINDYREWVQKGADATQQAEETLAEISSLAKQAIDNISAEYENKTSLGDTQIEQYEAYNSLLETDLGFESAEIYSAMIDATNKNITTLEQQRDKMQAELNKRVESGQIKKESQDWYDAINDIAAVDTKIIELQTDTENWQDSINELHWDQFDLLIKKLEAVSDEADNLIDILSNEDLVNEDTAEWTDEGVTSLGLYAQKMEAAEVQAKQFEEEIAYLNKNWKKLGYTEEEYVDKLDELKSGQYDAIQLYYDTKDAIKDLTSERVDAIKKGIEKEIEAYEELIDKKKEELDAEKDLYDFQRSIEDSQKEISDIERKLAALSGDNSASARAQRAKLEAELAKAQQELQDKYYDRSVSDQQQALDKELESFQEEKNKEMEGWDKYLENTNQVVADALSVVQANTNAVYQTLLEMGKTYSLSISESLLNPWKAGEDAIASYGAKLNMSLTKLAAMLGMTVDEMAAKLGMTTEELVSNLDITVAQLAQNLGLPIEKIFTKLGMPMEKFVSNLNITVSQLAQNLGLTIDEMAAKLGMPIEKLGSMMDLTIQQLSTNMGIPLSELADKLGVSIADLGGIMDLTIQQLADSMGMTLPELADKLETTTAGLVGNLDMTMAQFTSKMGLTVEAFAAKFGLSIDGLALKLGMTTSQMIGAFGSVKSKTVEELTALETEFNTIMNRIAQKAIATANRVKAAMSSYTSADYTPPPAPQPQPEPKPDPAPKPVKTIPAVGDSVVIKSGTTRWGSRSSGVKMGDWVPGATGITVAKVAPADGQHSKDQVRVKRKGTILGWVDVSRLEGYAKGTAGVNKDQFAIIDELGEELVMHAGANGRLSFMSKGSAVIPHDITENLMQLGELNPQDVLDRSRPVISAPHITNNNIEVNIEYGDVLHIDNFSGDKPENLSKLIDKAFDKHMKDLNQQIRRFTR